LGPAVRKDGTSFRLLAPQADSVSLGVFPDPRSHKPKRAFPAEPGPGGIWTAFAPGVGVGALYAWSVGGPDLPGARFDPDRFLLDPGGWEIGRMPSAGRCGLSRVVDPEFDWGGTSPPAVAPSRRVVYELHAKGFTRLHPSLPPKLRGTLAGLAHRDVLAHVRELGITTVELLPVHAHMDEAFLLDRGLVDYWGYNTLSWFAPHPGFASDGRGADEFRHMVRALHRSGLEVVLDVVYNHSCESGPDGPVTGLRGLGTWYRPDPADPALYEDLTGCGNTLDFRMPHVRTLVLESLRHWVRVFHVDGFRFDLASVLGRTENGFDPHAPFFRELAADPLLAGRILVSEPWDATPRGYAMGRFPEGWMDWNDRFRDDLRLFWKGEADSAAFSARMGGSRDLFGGRESWASVNYAACHDGFTLRDLCTYLHKRNEPNGESNRDGSAWNHSDNLGHEGDSVDPLLLERRALRARNLLAGALLSLGTPMLQAGDEMGRTQEGNNNAYCQDNAVSWLDWHGAAPWPDAEWISSILALRRELKDPVFDHSWLPGDRPDVSGSLLRSGKVQRLLLARRSPDNRPVPLPPGTWKLRLDTSTDAGAVAGIAIESSLPGGGEAFFVLDSKALGNDSVKAENSAARPGRHR
jgi:glycogen operon protein